MQTSLPDLRICLKGIEVEHTGFDSSPTCQHFITGLKAVAESWTSFPTEVHQAIEAAMTRQGLPSREPLTVGNLFSKPTAVANESELRIHAHMELHVGVSDVMKKLGIEGRFSMAGSNNLALIGHPDFLWWRGNDHGHQSLIATYKSEWTANLLDLAVSFSNTNTEGTRNALQQIYGYMVLNGVKFGILSNWTRTWFLRRPDVTDDGVLGVYGPIGADGSSGEPSLLKAWVGMVLLSEGERSGRFPRTSHFPPERELSGTMKAGVNSQEDAINSGVFEVTAHDYHRPTFHSHSDIDHRFIRFIRSTARGLEQGCVVEAVLMKSVEDRPGSVVLCKVVDTARYAYATNQLEAEARVYAHLHNLQGKVIPKLYGYYNLWGILHFLALEHVGHTISEKEKTDPSVRSGMKGALKRIHDAGYLHGDIALRNFCLRDGQVFIVDLETCHETESLEDQEDEMRAIDWI